MKSISPVVSIILLIVITISMASVSYLWFSGLFSKFLSQTEKQIEYISDVSLLEISYGYWYDYRDGLVLELRFDEGEGNVSRDYSGNGNDGKLENFCPPNGIIWNGHCYWVIDQMTNWSYAEYLCEQQGGHLVTITSPEENEFVRSLWVGKVSNINSIWLGMIDPDNKNYYWITGEPVTYTNWAANEPSSTIETRVHMYSNGKWNDLAPTSTYGRPGPLCEKEIWVDGIIGKALEFDGVDDYVNVSNSRTLQIPKQVTMLAWIYPYNLSNIWQTIHRKPDSYEIHLKIDVFDVVTKGTGHPIRGYVISYRFKNKVYYFISATIDSKNLKIYYYVNGKKVGERDLPSDYGEIFQSSSPFYLSYPRHDTTYFNGIIDELRIYSKALSEDIIRNLFYPIQLVIYNPSTKPIKIENSTISITNLESKRSCMFRLIYNQTYITDPSDKLVIYPNEQITLKVSIVECPGVVERGKDVRVCLIYKGKENCRNVRVPT